MKITVFGLGNWGTALAHHLGANGHNVTAWARDPEVVESVNARNKNSKYLSHIELSPNVKATTDLSAVEDADMFVLVVPSFSLSEVLPKLTFSPDAVVVSGIKGIDVKSGLTPLECVEKYTDSTPKLSVLSGPGFAKDIAAQRPAGLVVASKDEETAEKVSDVFSSDSLKVYTSSDPLGVELGGIVKNVVAVAAGVSDGLELGDSARAGLITRGLAEMMRLAKAMGAEPQTLSGLSGLGDLVLTATCDASRNRTVGLRLGKGEKLDHIIATLGSVAEGVKTTPLVSAFAKKYGIEMPITGAVEKLLKGEMTASETVRSLMARPPKREF